MDLFNKERKADLPSFTKARARIRWAYQNNKKQLDLDYCSDWQEQNYNC